MNFSLVLKKILRRSESPRLYSTLPNPFWALFVSTFLGVALIASARAELLVLQPGGSGMGFGHVVRIDVTRATAVGAFGQENEALYAIAVTPAGEVVVGANVLGYGIVYRFSDSGRYLGRLADLPRTEIRGLAAGPGGAVYAAVMMAEEVGSPERRGRVLRIEPDGLTTVFVAGTRGGLSMPGALAFGPDGHLHVADAAAGVMRFSGATGAFIDVLVPLGHGGLPDAAALAFGTNGTLDVASARASAVFRFAAGSGAYLGIVVAPGSGGLSGPRGLAHGPDGALYVSSPDTHQVLRYDAQTGAFVGSVGWNAELRSPTALAFTGSRPAHFVSAPQPR
jgi:streptogramin lyase